MRDNYNIGYWSFFLPEPLRVGDIVDSKTARVYPDLPFKLQIVKVEQYPDGRYLHFGKPVK